MFVLIIINDFEEFNLKEDNPVEEFKENLEIFRKSWGMFTKEFRGLKIRDHLLISFISNLAPPLGKKHF